MKKTSIAIILAGSILAACSDSSKTNPPQMSLTSISPALGQDLICGFLSENVISIQAGDTLKIGLNITAENELSQLKIDIHENSDCHEHEHKDMPFNKTIIKNLSGLEANFIEEIAIPSHAAHGNYHIDVQTLDQKGNEGNSLEYNLIIN